MKEKITEQDKFIDNIEKEFTIRTSYVLLLIFSSIIATLGLLTNSGSVIIGSMLISPLFWPVLGISLSIVFSDKRLIRKAIFSFVGSILIVFLTSYILTKILPIVEPSNEILVRTNPTLIDLLIALAVSVIGVLAIRYKGISQTAAGVAISIALLPVLCVVGIGAAFGSMDIFSGSFLLFLANAGAIIFVGATLMYFMGIRPKYMDDGKIHLNKKYITTVILMILLAIPLTMHLKASIDQVRMKSNISNIMKAAVMEISEKADVRSVEVIFPPTFSDEKTKVSAVVFLPQHVTMLKNDEQSIIDKISQIAENDVELRLNMFNMISLEHEANKELDELRINIKQLIENEIASIDTNIKIDTVYTQVMQEDDIIQTFVTIQQFSDNIPITFEQKQSINEKIKSDLGKESELTIEFVPAKILTEENEEQKMQNHIENVLEQDIAELSEDASLISVTVSAISDNSDEDATQNNEDVKVVAVLFVPITIEVTQAYKNKLLTHIQEEIDKKVELTLQIINFEDM